MHVRKELPSPPITNVAQVIFIINQNSQEENWCGVCNVLDGGDPMHIAMVQR